MDNFIPTRKLASRVLEIVGAGLCYGKGNPVPGEMCVEAAVCYAMGLPHGDRPPCVSPALRSLKISLNDKDWSSNQTRAIGLKRLAIAQLGSAGHLDDNEFSKRVSKMIIRKIIPLALRYAASLAKDEHKAALLEAANVCAVEGSKKSANAAAYAANAAERDNILSYFAEEVVQILINMKAPGCEFLDLTEVPEQAILKTKY